MFSRIEDVLPPPKEKSVCVWRYLDLPKFISLLSNRKLFLSRSDAFRDPHEGSITDRMKQALEHQFRAYVKAVGGLSTFRRHLRECTFVNCWHMSNYESEAMWKLYCGDVQGVAIQTTYQQLEDSLPKNGFHLRPIRYIDYTRDGFPQDNLIYSFFHKRIAFNHEQEVRIVKVAWDQVRKGISVDATDQEKLKHERSLMEADQLRQQRGMGITIDWDIETIVKSVYVHPYAQKWYFDVVRNVIEKFMPALSDRLLWSGIRQDPVF